MGLEESKIGQTNKANCNTPNLCFFAPVSPGRIIHQCTLELWKKSHRELFNFSDKVMVCTYQLPHDCTSAFCLTRQNIVNFRKSCSVFSLRKRREYTKMAEHFEYNHIPAHLSSIQNLHFKSVLDIHSGLAVVHLARDMITQFALVDLRINKFLGSFGRQTVLFSPESTIGKISPDGTYCLIRLPWSRNRRVYILKLYNLRNSELISELPLANSSNYDEVPLNSFRLPLGPYQENNRESNIRPSYDILSTSNSVTANFRGNVQNENQLQLGPARSSQVLFAFDPRFVNSRIAITNVDFPHGPNSHKVSSNWVPGIQATISLVKLPTWECLTSTNKLCSWSPSNRHGSPFINNATCREPTRRRRSSDANHTEFKKQQPFISPTCLLIQPRNLNLSHHLSTSLPSPLSKVHLSSGSSPFRQMTGCSSLELSVSSYRPMAVSFESSFIGTQCNSSSSCTATVSTRTSNSSGVVVTSAGTSVVNSTVQIDVLLVYQLPPPPKLQALVRQRIRQLCKDEYLEQLDLPRRIISYLQFEPSYNCAGSCISRSNSSTRTVRSDSFDL
ncbi:unnamed protein product [Schistosoma mattheei]|uniref:SOCS box domain-containing protein n=1 Tax=Schistosoma mattheei TaxID=31246 RepID=A0AA85C1B8_9TREM|nr:unnamed protein product [Schistosoma mattheei]